MRSGTASRVYYMGNHLTFATDGEAIAIPSYAKALDYELELGFVLAQPLLDADAAKRREAAIGGFVVLNDFSARDVQLAEMASGFGPQKSKHFRSAISKVVVTADEILPRWRDLKGFVRLNGALVAEPSTAGAQWSLGEVLAHASRCEQLHAGELFGSGTLPGGSGIETGHALKPGDRIEIGHRGHRYAREPDRVKEHARRESHRSVEADPLQPRRSALHAGARQAQAPRPREAARVAARPAAAALSRRTGPAGPTTPSPRWACIRRRTSMRPGTTGRLSGGKRAQTIEEIPLEKCIGPGVVLDLDAQGRQRRDHGRRPQGRARQDRRQARPSARSC